MLKRISLFLLAFLLFVSRFSITSNAQSDEEYLLSLVNAARVENGLNTLSLDAELTKAADVRAEEASVKYSHIRPDGTDYYTVSDAVYGENLAKASSYNTLDEVYQIWMDSTEHRENILYSGSTKTGFSICKTADGSYYVAEEFN